MNNNFKKNADKFTTHNVPRTSTFEKRDGIGTNKPIQEARPGYKPNTTETSGK